MQLKKLTAWNALPLAAALAASALLLVGPADQAQAQQKGRGKGAAAKGKAAEPAVYPAIHVQGNVWMIPTPQGNTVVSVGDWGVMVVDTQSADLAPQIIAEIRKISDKPIRYVIDTSADPTSVGGNAPIARAGAPVTGGNLGAVAFENGATIVAHENVLMRMLDVPEGQKDDDPDSLPTTTFFQGQKEIFFNEEPVRVVFEPKAHTDGDSVVYFRRSDVVAAGGVFDMEGYPHIEVDKGGSVQGVLDALNQILDFCIPRHEQEGGTYVIPGHGRLTDEHDVLEYRDMVTIVRDRVKAAKDKGMTLAQIKASNPTFEYDPRYGKDARARDTFVEAVFNSL